jgi:hypothetical protein
VAGVRGRGARRARRRAEEAAAGGEAAGAAWLALMAKRGRVTPVMVRAAVDIRHGQMTDASVGGLRSVDPTRLVVDGGAVCLNLHPRELGGHAGALGGEARVRWLAYERAVRTLPGRDGLLRGRRGDLWRFLVVVRVLVDGVRPYALDAELGVREGTCAEAVLRELERYAALHHFCP